MIWICTFFVLVVSAWLFFNALNERRWIQAHSHDETVAADKGFLPSFSASTGSGSLGVDGKISISEENSTFARAVATLQEKTANFGENFLESKVAAARVDESEQRPASASEENNLFGRAVARVTEKAERMDQKVVAKMKTASSSAARTMKNAVEEGTLIERTTRKVAAKSEDAGHIIANRAKNMAQGFDKVSGGMGKIGAKMAASRAPKSDSDEDLMTRIASKVGSKINEMDEKIVSASKNAANKIDKS